MASTVDQIAIKLGIQTGDLKAALKDAGADIKKFKKDGESTEDEGLLGQFKNIKKSINEFRNLLVAGGIATAVVGFFNLAIKSANESKDALDENARAVRDFGKEVTDSKGIIGGFAILVVGTFNRLGEAIGETINIARQGWSSWARNQDMIAATAAAAEAAEKRYAAVKKQHGAEFEKLNKELLSQEEKLREEKDKGLSVFHREAKIRLEIAQLAQQLEEFEGPLIERRRMQVELAGLLVDRERAIQDSKKEEARIESERAKEEEKMNKTKEEDYKKHVQLTERRLELEHQALPIAARITALEEAKAIVTKRIQDDKRDGLDTEEDTVRVLEINKELEEERTTQVEETVKAQKKITDEIDKQNKEIAKQEAAYKRLMESEYIKTKGDIKGLSEVQLEALLQKLKRDLAPIQEADRLQGGVGIRSGTFRSIENIMGSDNIAAIEKELRSRRDVDRAISFFGEDKASTMFAPDEFSRLAALLNPDQAKKQAADIGLIAGTLARRFPKQAQNIRP